MPGFCVSNLPKRKILNNRYPERCVQGALSAGKYDVQWNTLDKYMNDKVYMQDEKNVYILEGVLLNKKLLLEKYQVESVFDLMKILFKEEGDIFFKEFRGSFSGAVFEKDNDRWLFFTDQIGTKTVYYYDSADGELICGSQLNYVTAIMKENEIKREADEHGMSCMLTYGYMLDNHTCVKNVRRIYPGDYLIWEKGEFVTRTYYTLNPKKNEGKTEEEYISVLDQAFKNAVKRLIEKDEEYGYRSILDISGGLDSRMIAYNAKELGCKNAIMICYSQSGSRDYKIAQKVANKLGYDFYFKSLNNAACLFQVDENVLMNNGSAFYDGITGGKDMLEILNSNDFGIELTGLLGDVYDCSMITEGGEEKPHLKYNKYRTSMVLEDDEYIYSNVIKRFKNNELFWFYTRGMLAGMSTFQIRQNYVEPMTPFGDVEFMEAYLGIPWKIRVKEKLLTKWLVDKQPDAAQIMYSLTGVTPVDEFTLKGKIKKIAMFLEREVRRQLHLLHQGFWMTPYEYWCKIYPEINMFAKKYYQETIGTVKEKKIIQKMEILMKEEKFEDKSLVLTVLSCYKNFLN